MKPIGHLLVATDFSAGADAAAEVAAQLTGQIDPVVEIVNVVDTSDLAEVPDDPAWRQRRVDDLHREVRHRLQAFADAHFAAAEDVHIHVRDGGRGPFNPAAEILRAARELGCDFVVLGAHGRSGTRLATGSVAEAVVRQSRLPVLTVRGGG